MNIGIGGIVLCALVVAVFVIGTKIKDHGNKLRDLEEDLGKKDELL